jgi:MFS family permease
MAARRNASLLLAICVEAMGYGAVFGLLADLQDKYRFPPIFGFKEAGLGLIAASAFPAALVGQLGLARFADRGHTRRLLWFGLATAAAGMIWFWLGSTLWEFAVARMLVGLGSGTFIPSARRAILAQDPHNPGKAISMAGAADIGGFLLGLPIAKQLEQAFDSPNTPFLVLGRCAGRAARGGRWVAEQSSSETLGPLEVQVRRVLPGEADATVDLDVLGGGVEVRLRAVALARRPPTAARRSAPRRTSRRSRRPTWPTRPRAACRRTCA